MKITASICTLCGLICITRKAPPKRAGCIQCSRPIAFYQGATIDEVWSSLQSDPPQLYALPDKQLDLAERFASSYERFCSRESIRNGDKDIASK